MRSRPAASRLALLVLLLLAWAMPARAQELTATLEHLSHVDRAGRWRPVDRSDQGSIFRAAGGAEELLVEGAVLGEGDRIRTRAARVQLALSDGSRLHLSEEADLTLQQGDGSRWARVRQEAGAIWYRMRNALTVEHATVETVVEGTRFLVVVEPAPAPVRVQVEQGRVRMQRGDGVSVSLKPHRQAAMAAEGPAPEVLRWRPSPADLARTWPLGRPRLTLDGLLAAHVPTDGAPVGGGLRLSAGLHLPARLRLVGEAGFLVEEGDQHVPGALGLSWQAGPVVLGGLGTAELERCTFDCPGEALYLHLGGAGFARAERQLSRRLRLLAELRVGYADGLRIEPGLGLGMGL